MKRIFVCVVAITVAILLISGCAPKAEPTEPTEPTGPERVEWQCSHWIPAGPIWDAGLKAAELVKTMSDGHFTIEVIPPGSILHVPEMYDGIRDGVLECAWCYPGYYVEKLPETFFESYTDFACKDMTEQMVYLNYRGARELITEGYKDFGLVYIPLIAGSVAGPIVSTVPLPNSKAIAGKAVRSSDVTAHYTTALGGTNVFVPIGDVFQLMSAGTVDAAAGIGAVDFYAQGMADIAKYWVMTPPVCPGWTDSFIVNPSAWEALPDNYKAILTTAVEAASADLRIRQEAETRALMPTLVKEGVTLIDWPAEDQDIFAKLAMPIVKENYIHTPRTDKLYELFVDFMGELYG